MHPYAKQWSYSFSSGLSIHSLEHGISWMSYSYCFQFSSASQSTIGVCVCAWCTFALFFSPRIMKIFWNKGRNIFSAISGALIFIAYIYPFGTLLTFFFRKKSTVDLASHYYINKVKCTRSKKLDKISFLELSFYIFSSNIVLPLRLLKKTYSK